MTSSRLRAVATEPVSAGSLVAFRWAFGLLALFGVVRFVASGWIEEFYLEPHVHLAYPGFEWITPWPPAGMYIHFAALGVLALLIATGTWVRGAALLFAVGFTYVELLDQTFYLNHYYLVSILALLLAVLPLHRGITVVPRWWVWALRLQVGLVYFFAGVAKLGPDWIVDAQPLKIWLALMDLPLVGDLVAHPWAPYLAAWFGAVFDLTIVGFLLWHRARKVAFVVLVGFHVATWLMFPIGLFPWIMIANATLFFAPDWPHAFRRLFGRSAPRDLFPIAPHPTHKLLRIFLGIHFALQLALPLRHFFYPGDVHWTEQGLRFSWKVMIVEKAGVARFEVRDPATGREWTVYPREYLVARQERMLSVQPEMIRQFAHFLADRFADRGITNVEVRADVEVAMNGRRRRRLIDPRVDLAREPFRWSSYRWILR